MTRGAVLRRVGQAVLVLWLAYTGAYVLLAALPGDAVMARFGNPDLGLTPEQLEQIRASYGVDRPLVVRYFESIGAFLSGDLGYSVQSGAAVSDLLAEALPSTLTLAALALAGAVFLAVVIAFTAAYGKGEWLRRLFRNLPPLFVSVPVFWIGIVLIQVFSFQLGLIPVIGASEAQALILPALTLTIPIAAPLAQVFLRSIDEVREQPFVSVVKARGASTSWLLWRNVAPNALLPVLTMAGRRRDHHGGRLRPHRHRQPHRAGRRPPRHPRAARGRGDRHGGLRDDQPDRRPALSRARSASAPGAGRCAAGRRGGSARSGARRRSGSRRSVRTRRGARARRSRSGRRAPCPVDPRPPPTLRSPAMTAVETATGLGPAGGSPRAARAAGSWRSLLRPGLILPLLVLLVALAWAVAPGIFTSQSPTETVAPALQAPSAQHWFGTDATGRDLFSRVVYGASESISAALLAVLVGLVFGSLIGVSAGAVGGWIDDVLMRLVEVLLAIPTLLLSLSIVILLGFGTANAAIAVGVTSVAVFARLSRSQVMSVRASEFVEAAYGSGGTFLGVLRRHVLPNSLTPVIALAALQLGSAILQISTLGFLGYGAPPPTPEWGLLIAEGRNYVATAWWLTTLPGLVVVLIVVATNRLSQAISSGGRV
jgi:peptide/nickel transport system permease protein